METINARRDRDAAQQNRWPFAELSLDEALAIYAEVARELEVAQEEVRCG
ncbi:MAG TPA: hypothetical protein VFT22_07080 [Kofleriaceae bacterium]|nr:hypothetical protein [Kofleriaceae bacterium]